MVVVVAAAAVMITAVVVAVVYVGRCRGEDHYAYLRGTPYALHAHTSVLPHQHHHRHDVQHHLSFLSLP